MLYTLMGAFRGNGLLTHFFARSSPNDVAVSSQLSFALSQRQPTARTDVQSKRRAIAGMAITSLNSDACARHCGESE